MVSLSLADDGWHVVIRHPWGELDFDPAGYAISWATFLAKARAALWGYQLGLIYRSQ